MGEVVELRCATRLNISTERILRSATEADLEQVAVIGFDQDGDIYLVSSHADGGDLLWLLERARHRLMKITDELEGEE